MEKFVEARGNVDSIYSAISLLDSAIANDPSFLLLYNNKVSMLLEIGQCEKATNVLDTLISFGPKDSLDLLLLKANLLEKVGDDKEANRLYAFLREKYQRQILDSPESIETSTKKIFVSLFIQDATQVFQEIEKLKEIAPSNVHVLNIEQIARDFNRSEYMQNICKGR